MRRPIEFYLACCALNMILNFPKKSQLIFHKYTVVMLCTRGLFVRRLLLVCTIVCM
jgi:hypothetical protein